MTRRIAAALAPLILTLGGCGLLHHHDRPHGDHQGARLHQRPLVYVKAGVISISPEPVVVQRSAGDAAVTFHVPAPTRFDGVGIEVLGRVVDAKGEPVPATQRSLERTDLRVDDKRQGDIVCIVAADQRAVTCRPQDNAARNAIYKYRIRLVHEGKLLGWDPNILHLD